MEPMSPSDVLFACESVIVCHPRTGDGVPVRKGEHWPANDPIVKAYPKFFVTDARFGLSCSTPHFDDGWPVYDEADLEPPRRAKPAAGQSPRPEPSSPASRLASRR